MLMMVCLFCFFIYYNSCIFALCLILMLKVGRLSIALSTCVHLLFIVVVVEWLDGWWSVRLKVIIQF